MTAPRRLTLRSAALALLVLAALVAGCSDASGKITFKGSASTTTEPADPDDPDSPDQPSSGTVDWHDCDDVEIAVERSVLSAAEADGMQCGELEVPVDHNEPDGDTIEVAIARLPATGSDSKRIGSLIVNPGGPGGSGLEFLASSGSAFSDDVRDRFDIVSFDPRGIAASTPIDCLTQDQRAEQVDSEDPDDPAAAVAQDLETEKTIADGCVKANDALFEHMGTDQVVGDLDMLRAAVGDEGLTFLGLSYGTRIAAAYATEFPDKVRAIVLDGSVTPSRDLVEQQGGQIKGIVRAFNALVEQCKADAACPLGADPLTVFNTVGDTLDATPLTVGDEVLTKDKYLTGVITALYDPSSSAPVLQAVAALAGAAADPELAQTGAKFLLKLAGLQSSKQPDGSYGNGFETQSIVNCLDADGPLEADELAAVRELAGPIPAILDSDPAADAPACTLLPTGDDLKIAESSATERLLVVGTEGDPATPIEWTRQMVTALGDPAVIIYGGSGHTASLTRSCVTDQVSAFFVDGAVPPDLADCPRDPAESDIYAQVAQQFEGMGVDAETQACIVDALREVVDPLTIVGDDIDPDLVGRIQDAVLGCR